MILLSIQYNKNDNNTSNENNSYNNNENHIDNNGFACLFYHLIFLFFQFYFHIPEKNASQCMYNLFFFEIIK